MTTSVVVLAGGLSYEREVSLRSGRRVREALRRAGMDAEVLDVDAQLLAYLADSRPDAVFATLHGAAGEDGALHDVLELLDLPYVGSAPAACRLAWDKPTTKAAAAAAGIRVPRGVALPHATFRELGAAAVLERIVDRLGLPLMVKPAQGGSALGTHAVATADELPAAMVGCYAYGPTALVEEFVAGTEVAVSVIDRGSGPVALPAVEIVPADGVNDYSARYSAEMAEWYAPARLPGDVADRLGKMAVRTHETLGLRDLSRTDAIVTPDGDIVFLEADVAPGMTDTSLLPRAVRAASLDFSAVCRDLVERAIARRG